MQRFTTALKTSLGAWHSACERDIDKLLQSVGATIATEQTPLTSDGSNASPEHCAVNRPSRATKMN